MLKKFICVCFFIIIIFFTYYYLFFFRPLCSLPPIPLYPPSQYTSFSLILIFLIFLTFPSLLEHLYFFLIFLLHSLYTKTCHVLPLLFQFPSQPTPLSTPYITYLFIFPLLSFSPSSLLPLPSSSFSPPVFL